LALRLLPLLLVTAAFTLTAQPAATTRAQQIEAARDEKSTHLSPDNPSKWEGRLIAIKDMKLLERLSYGVGGLRVALGQMGTGGGFALGPDYFREDLWRGEVQVHAGAYASIGRWTKFVADVAAPSFANNKMFWHLGGVRHNYNSISYFGSGPDTTRSGRSSFRFEDVAFDTTLGIQPVKYVRIGSSVGTIQVNTGPGKSKQYASADILYPNVPGMQEQSDFYRWGGFFQIDYRDSATGPRSGGNYIARYNDFQDRTLHRYSFRRFEAEANQYISFYNKRRVFALRGRAVYSYPDRNQAVPFYMQAVLGGSDDLRGFRPYRFYDDNLLLMNAEYRWEVFSGLDMAVFADAGKVASRRSDINFKDLESTVGFGLRFNVRNSTFMRIDTGFSHEGFQIWFKFSDVFVNRPPYMSSTPNYIR
jgi:hypothetical protein